MTQLDYTFDRQIMLEREDAREEGREEGREEVFKILDEIHKGNNTLEKLVKLGYDLEMVKKVLNKMK